MEEDKFEVVVVVGGPITDRWSKCTVKTCQKRDKYIVCICNGEPDLDDVFRLSCNQHLIYTVDKAIKEARRRNKKILNQKSEAKTKKGGNKK